MAKSKDSAAEKAKPKPAKPKADAGKDKPAKPKDDAKAKEKDKGKEKEAAAPPPAPPKPERAPADPRLKVLKKFYGKFLPRGPLRDRHKALMARWESDADHGGVTLEELKALLADWRAGQAKPVKVKV